MTSLRIRISWLYYQLPCALDTVPAPSRERWRTNWANTLCSTECELYLATDRVLDPHGARGVELAGHFELSAVLEHGRAAESAL